MQLQKRRPRLRWGEGKTERGSNVEQRGRNGVVCTQRAMLQRWREPLRKGKTAANKSRERCNCQPPNLNMLIKVL